MTTLPVRPGLGSIGHGQDPLVGAALLGDVGLAASLHLIRDRQGSGPSRTKRRAGGHDVGPRCNACLRRLLPRLHGEPGSSGRQGHLHATGPRPIWASRLLGIHPWLTAWPPATQRLRRAARPSRAWRVPTPDRPRSRLLYSPMPTRGLARRLAYLTGESFGHPRGGHPPCSSDCCVVEDGGGPVGHGDFQPRKSTPRGGPSTPSGGMVSDSMDAKQLVGPPGSECCRWSAPASRKFDMVGLPFTRPEGGRLGVNL